MANRKTTIWNIIKSLTTKRQRKDLNISYTRATIPQLERQLKNLQDRENPQPFRPIRRNIGGYNELRRQAVELGVYDHKNRSKAALLEAIFNALNKVPFIEEKKERENKEKDRRLYFINELYKEAEKLGIPNYKNLSPTQLNNAIQQKYKALNLNFKILKVIKDNNIIIPKELKNPNERYRMIIYILNELRDKAKKKRFYNRVEDEEFKTPEDEIFYINDLLTKTRDYFPFIQLLDKIYGKTIIIPSKTFNKEDYNIMKRNQQNEIKTREEFGNQAFTLVLYSSKLEGELFRKTFKHLNHLVKWFRNFTEDNKNSGADEFETFKDNNAFEFVDYDIFFLRGGCSRLEQHKKIADEATFSNSRYDFYIISPPSRRNNCGLECIRYIYEEEGLTLPYKNSEIRKKYGLEPNSQINTSDLVKIYNDLSKEIGYNVPLCIIEPSFKGNLYKTKNPTGDENFNKAERESYGYNNYLVLGKNHYTILDGFKDKYDQDFKSKMRKCRGEISWDCEARRDLKNPKRVLMGIDEETGEPIYRNDYYLIDTMTRVRYKSAYSKEEHHIIFTTDKEDRSLQKFQNWLISQSNQGRYYNCIGWNTSRFDNFLFTSVMDYNDTLISNFIFRGKDMINIIYYGHNLKDCSTFIDGSLEAAGKGFKIDNQKQTTFNINGKTITSGQLCFYRPELDIWEFMELEKKEPEFWALYSEYCKRDVDATWEVWNKFKKCVNDMTKKIHPGLLKRCNINYSTTIGGLSLKIIQELNKDKADFKHYCKFLEGEAEPINIGDRIIKFEGLIDDEKYRFVEKFKRGGISMCQKAGKHETGTHAYDVSSLYSTAMKYMNIPAGVSSWVDTYDGSKYGYYHIKNLRFDNTRYKFKPVATVKHDKTLNWETGDYIEEAYLNTETVNYLVDKFGLVSFEVERGLISSYSIKGSVLFGQYVDKIFKIKKEIDEQPEELKNIPLRKTVKLFLNSVTGKLVEDTMKHTLNKYVINSSEVDTDTRQIKTLNGVGIESIDQAKPNWWLNAGVSLYFMSKSIMWKYMECLPDFCNDVIQSETDSLYIPSSIAETFENNLTRLNHKYIKLGSDLGNLVCEKSDVKDALFLGKKFYKIGESMKSKGVAPKSLEDVINEDGEMETIIRPVITPALYDEIFKQGCLCPCGARLYDCGNCEGGGGVKLQFNTLERNLYGKTSIVSTTITRTIKPPEGVIYKTWREGKAVN